MSDSTSNEKTRRIGGIVALIGAGLMAAMVWAPWIGSGGETITGWDIHEQAIGSEQWYIGDFVDPDFSPFFPGLPILVTAGVIGLLAVVLLTRPTLSRGAGMIVRLIGALAFLVSIVDLISIIVTGPGSDIVSFEWGLIGVAVAGVVGVLGVSMGSGVARVGKKTPA